MTPDNPLPLNCPKCPRRLHYMRATEEGFPLYVCVQHGWFIIGADGRLQARLAPPEPVH